METFDDLDLEHFRTEREGHVGVVRIDRPPANAHNIDVLLELQRAAEVVRFDETVRVAILGSANDRFFSAGYDIKALQEEDPRHIGYSSQTSKEIIMKMRTSDTVWIAMVNGHCMGGGLELALACDLRHAADDADLNVGTPEIKLGLIPGEAGTQMLPRIVGRQAALRLMLTGDPISPQEAHELGLFDELHAPEALEEETFSAAKRLAGLPNKALGHIKLAVNEGMEMSLSDALAHERELQNQLFDTPGAREGIGAFLEKREPDFLGAELGKDARKD